MARQKTGRKDAENSAPAAPGKPFPKGRSGNPGGLPGWVRRVRELAGAHSEEAARKLVALIFRQKKALKVSLAAAEAILDRGGAKPIQPIEVSGPGGEPLKAFDLSRLSDAQLEALATLLAAARPGGGEGGEGAPAPR